MVLAVLDLLDSSVCINIDSMRKFSHQSGTAISAFLNTGFQITLDFDSSYCEETMIKLDRVKEGWWNQITCPWRFRILVNERCDLYRFSANLFNDIGRVWNDWQVSNRICST